MRFIGHALLFMFGGCAGSMLAGLLASAQLRDMEQRLISKDEEIARLRDRLKIALGRAEPAEETPGAEAPEK